MTSVTAPQQQPFWATPLGYGAIALLLSLPMIVVTARLDLLVDESYYALWSVYPGPGYFDHSPGIAWIVAAGRALFGEGAFAIRIFTNLLEIVTLAALYRLGVIVFGDARIGAVAGFFYAVSLAAGITFAIATPDGLSTTMWILALWALAELARGGKPAWWLALGVFAGLGLLSKYTNVMLAPGILLYMLINPKRRAWFGLWQLWAGVAIALLLFAPVIWWNAQHDWASFRFQLSRSSFTGEHGGPALFPFVRFWLALLILLLPPAFLLALAGFGTRWTKSAPMGLDLPILTSLPSILFFAVHSFVNTANPNWLTPVYPVLMLIAGWVAVDQPYRGAIRNWLGRAVGWVQIALGVAIIGFVAVSVSLGEVPFVGQRAAVSFGRGWDDLAVQIAKVARENDAGWIDTENYLLLALIGYGAVSKHVDMPVLQSNEPFPFRYSYRPPLPPELAAGPHVLVQEIGADQAPLPPAGMTTVAVLQRKDGEHVLGYLAVYLAPS